MVFHCPPLSLGGTMSTMLLEVKLTPCRHRIEIHHIRTKHKFLVWQYDCDLRLQADPSQG